MSDLPEILTPASDQDPQVVDLGRYYEVSLFGEESYMLSKTTVGGWAIYCIMENSGGSPSESQKQEIAKAVRREKRSARIEAILFGCVLVSAFFLVICYAIVPINAAKSAAPTNVEKPK